MAINALTAAARLESVDAGYAGAVEAKGILGNLSDALAGAYGMLNQAGATPAAKAVGQELDATDTEA